MSKELMGLVDRLSYGRVLVVGDLILDRYVWGRVERVSPEAPVPVFSVQEEECSPGGAANVAVKVSELGASAVLIGVVGGDKGGDHLCALARRAGVDVDHVLRCRERPTTEKTRYIAQNQQLVRVDREVSNPISIPRAVQGEILSILSACSMVIVEDYGKGVLTPEVLSSVFSCPEISVVVDPCGIDWGRYQGADLVTPNQGELELAYGQPISSDMSLLVAGRSLLKKSGVKALAVTRGSKGITLITSEQFAHIPTTSLEVFDVTGAGDAVVAVFALALMGGLVLREAAELANLVGGIIVCQSGTGSISRGTLTRKCRGRAASKFCSQEEVAELSGRTRARGGKVVFTNGCFDLLHPGHISLLEQAASYGELLIVAINSDTSVRELKGVGRPVIRGVERVQLLGALECVGAVVVFEENTPESIIEKVRPDVLIKGEEYEEEEIVGAELVRSYGGEVVRVPLLEGVSTSGLLERLREGC